VVPPGYGTLQVIMVDTVTLLGELKPPGTHSPASASVTAAAVAASATSAPVIVPAAVAPPTIGEATDAAAALAAVTGGGRRHLSDFNLPDDPPPESTLQWSWLEARTRAPCMHACMPAFSRARMSLHIVVRRMSCPRPPRIGSSSSETTRFGARAMPVLRRAWRRAFCR
jgi:hypothetical protein